MVRQERTGKTGFRISWFGKLILQVEVFPEGDTPRHMTLWIDATVNDLRIFWQE